MKAAIVGAWVLVLILSVETTEVTPEPVSVRALGSDDEKARRAALQRLLNEDRPGLDAIRRCHAELDEMLAFAAVLEEPGYQSMPRQSAAIDYFVGLRAVDFLVLGIRQGNHLVRRNSAYRFWREFSPKDYSPYVREFIAKAHEVNDEPAITGGERNSMRYEVVTTLVQMIALAVPLEPPGRAKEEVRAFLKQAEKALEGQ